MSNFAIPANCASGNNTESPEQVFQWTPLVTGEALINTCDQGGNPILLLDTVVYIAEGACSDTMGQPVIACADQGCAGNNGSTIRPVVTAGVTYTIIVDGWNGAAGDFILEVLPPGAFTTTTSTSSTSSSTTTSTSSSTTTSTVPGACEPPRLTVIPPAGGQFEGETSGSSEFSSLDCENGPTLASPEAVFEWTPAVSGNATIETCGGITAFDTVIYLREGSCRTGLTRACNDSTDESCGLLGQSRMVPTVTAGTTYYIFVDGFAGASGEFTLTVTPPNSP